MKKSIFAAVMFGLFLVDQAMADLPIIDRTDKVHERRYLDSLNVYNRRPIRINQSGFRPQDYKYAYVADPTEMTFKVIDANTGREVSGGGNLTLIRKNVVKPNMWINGAFNSLASVYEFGSQDSTGTQKEDLYRADFTTLNTQGEYYIVVGNDTYGHVGEGRDEHTRCVGTDAREDDSVWTALGFILGILFFGNVPELVVLLVDAHGVVHVTPVEQAVGLGGFVEF